MLLTLKGGMRLNLRVHLKQIETKLDVQFRANALRHYWRLNFHSKLISENKVTFGWVSSSKILESL